MVEGVDGSGEHLKPPQPPLPPSLWEPGAGEGSQAKDPTSPTTVLPPPFLLPPPLQP